MDGLVLYRITYGNKTSVAITPTDAGKISNIQHKSASGMALFNYPYGYYPDGKIETINDGTKTATLFYDDKNRITDVSYSDGSNQLKDYVKNGVTTNFSYDVNGNTKTVTGAGKSIEYVYDTQNRLTDIKNNGVVIASYQYDGESQRVSKTVNGITTTYVYSQGLLLAEKDASVATIASYLYDDMGQTLSMTRGSETYYYHFNDHGNTIALTDNNGNVAQTYMYDIWGNILESTGSIENPFTYGGQWGYVYDSESSLYFLKTRYYESSIGRFISRDRFAGFENDSDSQNRYVYCQNDPVGNVDPTGYWYLPIDTILKLLIVIGINPIGSYLIGLGFYKLRSFIVAKYVMFIARLGAIWGPVVQWSLVAAVTLIGIPTVSDLVKAIRDCILQVYMFSMQYFVFRGSSEINLVFAFSLIPFLIPSFYRNAILSTKGR